MNTETNILAISFVSTFLVDDKSRWAIFKSLVADMQGDVKGAGAECRKALVALNTIKGVTKLNAMTVLDEAAATQEKDYIGKANKTIRNYTWLLSKAIDLKINYKDLAYSALEKKVTEVNAKTKTPPKPKPKPEAHAVSEQTQLKADDELTAGELKAEQAQLNADAEQRNKNNRQAIVDAQVVTPNVHSLPVNNVTAIFNLIKSRKLNRVELLDLIDRLDMLAEEMQELDQAM